MNQENHILEALEIVGARDIRDENLAYAISFEAKLIAGVSPDELWEVQAENN